MALDEPKETDATYNVKGFIFIMDKALVATVQKIIIDLGPMGFSVTGTLVTGGARAGGYSCA